MKKNQGPLRDVLIIDAQNDYISGVLACINAVPAVEKIVQYLNRNQTLRAFYSLDFHPPSHCSFESEGGLLPKHCVQETDGCEVSWQLHEKLHNPAQKPRADNSFYKGQNEALDEYSAFDGRTADGRRLRDELGDAILLCGMSTEFCVKESAEAFASAGFDVALYVPGLAWIDQGNHFKVLNELAEQGIQLIHH